MTTEICRWPFAIAWRISPDNPCLTQWRRNELGARWQDWREFETPQDARAAMFTNGINQYEPQETDA
jgi:hypothetical protein